MDEVFSYIPVLLFGMCWHPTHPEGMSGIPGREWASRLVVHWCSHRLLGTCVEC